MANDDILIVMYGKCAECGKLTPPVSTDDYDFETSAIRMMEAAADRKWSVILNEDDSIKLRCPVCAREVSATAAGSEPPTVTMVTEFG